MRNGVVASHYALDLHAQNLGEHRGIGGDETALRNLRRLGKTRVVRRKINLADEPIGGLDVVNPGELEFLRQSILQRAKHPLRAPARLRRIGRNMLDPKPIKRTPDLRRPALVNRLPRLRRVEIMAAPIGIEAPPKPLP